MNTRLALLAAVGATALAFAVPALADEAPIARSARVAFGDLNLEADAGVSALYLRLRTASRQVCESGQFRDVVDQRCAARALDQAVASVGNGRLATLHALSAHPTSG
ncbi:MAG: UrcA family protein [Proteobacteria bacterium]|nr:UrcA family protein [Pseudomonadota bacterium]